MKDTKISMETEEGVCLLVINSPSNMNCMTQNLIAELTHAIDKIEKNEEIKVVIITGAGRSFIAGADISYMKSLSPDGSKVYALSITNVYKKIEASLKVYIAGINGYALGGGCELALACDLRVASTQAKFGFPETSIGIIPGGGGTQRLPKLVGYAKAKEMIFTGELISATEAHSIGLVNRVVAQEQLISECRGLATKIKNNGAIAVGLAKASINISMQVDLYTGIIIENNNFGLCFSTDDQKEGMEAFLDKRPPKFKSK